MKKKIALILVCAILICSYFIVGLKKENLYLGENEYKTELIASGLENAEDFIFDKFNNIYVSKDSKVIKINKDNSKELVFEEKKIKIKDIAYLNDEIFYLYDDKLNSYNLSSKRHKLILDSIPSYGDYSDNKLLVKDEMVYLTVGASTNSGVVGKDNEWRESKKYDLSPEEITINKNNFNGTSAYAPYKVNLEEEYTVKGSDIGNASVIKINPVTKEKSLVASGVRNVEGIDFDSKGQIYMAVGGMEDRGDRPLYGDADYLYSLENEGWYGWPDYSGGDAVDSVRFRKEGKVKQKKIIKDQNKDTQAPLYQHDAVDVLGTMAIDKGGEIESKDSFFIYDKLKGSIFNIQKTGAKKAILELKNSEIEKIIVNGENIYALDRKNGYILKIFKKNNIGVTNKNVKILFLSLTVMITIGILLVLCLKRKSK
ncbi:MAG: hypothetical protein ACRCWG_07695 [Sarcina sp.]